MRIDTILLDLDGTLLPFRQRDFVGAYFSELKKMLAGRGLDAELGEKAVWAGTKAMMRNDGSVPNALRFWQTFGDMMGLDGERLLEVERACDAFYSNEFDAVKTVMRPTDIPRRMIRSLAARGFTVALATNPLFPACAVITRLAWVGLTPDDFSFISDYYNSTTCKPNLDYYRSILSAIGKQPEQCLMAGNNVNEDICAGALGIKTFLVNDFTETDGGTAAPDYQGSLAELEVFFETSS